MTWAPLLLSDPSPILRFLVLKKLMNRQDSETEDLKKRRINDPLVKELEKLQNFDGSWNQGVILGNAPGGAIQTTSQVLTRLGYMEIYTNSMIKKGAEYIFSKQLDDGSWPLPNSAVNSEGENQPYYDVMSLQTSIPLRGLAACGYATDKRAEKAYDWLLQQRLEDGSWPTGIASGNYGYVAGYRKLPHSRWGCRSNTTGALTCLSLHPKRRSGEAAQRALDLLLGRETRERQSLGFEVARTIGAEPSTGFITFYARFDLVHILDLCWRVGATVDDERVNDLVEYLKSVQGQYGLWEYINKPYVSKWITYDLLNSLMKLEKNKDWVTLEPRTPFQTYPSKRKRY